MTAISPPVRPVSSATGKQGDCFLDSLLAIVLWIFSYLLGSVSAAILACRLCGFPDPRTTGSQNPGATNVLRVGNKFAAMLTLVGDVGKGMVPILIARHLGMPEPIAALCGFCAFLGHLYPVYFDFRGGKGVATAFGVLAILHWPTALVLGALWVLVFVSTRFSSLASIVTFFLTPFGILLTHGEVFYPVLILSLILLWRHRHNLILLLRGREQGFRRTPPLE
ncbi:MAG: acyl-phosphate glycerol 3-phosphate acyltransferase [Pseudomonadales bacterium]|nr:acyl-phosphate glycerol 3-phosphate acyltransferase [Pseudomonadales bacterium]